MKTGISLDSLELSVFKKKLIHFKKNTLFLICLSR